ncbi:MAG: HmuY family protein [Balneolaceae bacterium]|nr:HmuY family protein [Balneolaceae bacterium]
MKNIINSAFLLLLGSTLIFTACEEAGNSGPAEVEAEIATDIQANVNTIFSPAAPATDVEGNTEENPGYTFYDLDAGSTVDDSLSAAWDIAFGGTTILANSGNGGGIQVLETEYDAVLEAPTSGYNAELSGSGSWYTYTGEAPNGPKHAVIADTNKTVVVLTSDGRYAKIQLLSYYEGNPDVSTSQFADFRTRPADKFFTFNYTIQGAETTQLYHEDKYTFFDFETGAVVEDSLSSQWDIGFNATTIIANFGNGGGIQALNIAFELVTEAPVEGYLDANTSWYTYTGQAPTGPKHAILPKDGTTLVVKTSDEKYAKIRVLNYYKGNPDTTTELFANFFTRPEDRHYTIEFAVQTDGSRFFE